MNDIKRRLYLMVIQARRAGLPVQGARLIVGSDVLDSIKMSFAPPELDARGVRFLGFTLEVNHDLDPEYMELRWSVHG